MLEYKGYKARIEHDPEVGALVGTVINSADRLTFDGDSLAQLQEGLVETVDAYLEFCAELGREPSRLFSGKFSVRLPPELHQRAALTASRKQQSLNSWIASLIDREAAIF